jgi:hypothetical protein
VAKHGDGWLSMGMGGSIWGLVAKYGDGRLSMGDGWLNMEMGG